jgi:hypothetical protein
MIIKGFEEGKMANYEEIKEPISTFVKNSTEELIEEIRGVLTEGIFASRWDLLECYHKVGVLLIDAEKKTPKIVSTVTQEIPQQRRTIYRCIQFVKKYPNINELPEGKNISWSKIINKYLPKETKPKPDLKARIELFISDLYPKDKRKAFIREIVAEWTAWKTEKRA